MFVNQINPFTEEPLQFAILV